MPMNHMMNTQKWDNRGIKKMICNDILTRMITESSIFGNWAHGKITIT